MHFAVFDFPAGTTYIYPKNMPFLWPGIAAACPDAAPARGSRIIRRGLSALFLLLAACLCLTGCASPVKEEAVPADPVVDLDQIRARGKLVAP